MTSAQSTPAGSAGPPADRVRPSEAAETGPPTAPTETSPRQGPEGEPGENAVPVNASPVNAAPEDAAAAPSPVAAGPTVGFDGRPLRPGENPFLVVEEIAPPEAPPEEQVELIPALQAEESLPDVTELPPLEDAARPPWTLFGRIGVGGGLRLGTPDGFQQETFAPAYLSLAGGTVFPSTGRLAQQLSLAIDANLHGDGTYPSGVEAFEQWVLAPAYGVRLGLVHGRDWGESPGILDAVFRLAIPIVVSPTASVGLEVSAGAIFRMLAGFGIYADLTYGAYLGGQERNGDRTVHQLMGLELGVQVDLELLR